MSAVRKHKNGKDIGFGCQTSRAVPSDKASNKAPPPKDSTAFPNSTASWGPGGQTREPVCDISDSNHSKGGSCNFGSSAWGHWLTGHALAPTGSELFLSGASYQTHVRMMLRIQRPRPRPTCLATHVCSGPDVSACPAFPACPACLPFPTFPACNTARLRCYGLGGRDAMAAIIIRFHP